MQKALEEAQEELGGPSENTSLSDAGGGRAYYGAATVGETTDEGSQMQSSFGESDYLLDSDWQDDDDDDDDDDDEEEGTRTEELSPLQVLWRCVKNVVVVVANVENLWDSPESVEQETSTAATTTRSGRRRNKLVVLFWFFVLAMSYTTERSSFKLLVDTAGPFRLFAVEMVTAIHAILLGAFILIAQFVGHRQQIRSLGIPLVDVGLMALLDTVSLLLVYITGMRVPPTLTVILVQFILPLTAFLTQFVHPNGRCVCCGDLQDVQQNDEASPYQNGDGGHAADEHQPPAPAAEGHPLPGYGGLSLEHVWGSLIIFLAVLLALIPAVYSLANPDFFMYADAIPVRTAVNTLLYATSCIPAAASQLYKEHIFTQFKQPVNMDYLNILLSIFQFTFVSIMAPLVFSLQGLGAKGDWTDLYPSTDFSENFVDGIQCFFGVLSQDDQANKYPDDARCQYTLGLVFAHALSIILVGVAVDKIVKAGATKVMYRGISAGIIASVLCMYVYDMNTPDFNYGPLVDALNLLCLILLILGSEVYHRVSLQDSSFETVYPPVENFFDSA